MKCNRLHYDFKAKVHFQKTGTITLERWQDIVRTIKEVAAMAKVSVATISRVINNDPAVTPATRERVLQVIEEMDYQPNLIGRHLRRSQTKKVIVLIPSISNQFYSKIITRIETTARNYGYKIMVCMSHSDKETELEYIEMLTTKVVDGMIFLSSKLDAKEMSAIAQKYPVVQCCEYIEGSQTDIVSIDNEKAAFDAVSILLEQGHSSIAFFGAKEKYNSGILREKGYHRALQEHGIKIDEKYLFFDGYSYPSGERMAMELLSLSKRPSAVFCVSDSIAIGCIKKLIDCGIKVPEEISVMGFDDTSIAKMYNPAISTVAQPQVEIGEMAMELLIKNMTENRKTISFNFLPHHLVLRETTRIAGNI